MVVILQLFELVKALFMTIGPAGANLPGFCTTQAAFIEFSSLCAVMWTCCLASNLRLLLTRKRKADALERRLRLQLVLTIVPSIVLSCIILGIGDFKNTRYWCWVDDGQRSEFHVFVYFNLWVVLALIFIAVTVILVLQVEPDLETLLFVDSVSISNCKYNTQLKILYSVTSGDLYKMSPLQLYRKNRGEPKLRHEGPFLRAASSHRSAGAPCAPQAVCRGEAQARQHAVGVPGPTREAVQARVQKGLAIGLKQGTKSIAFQHQTVN